MKKTVSLVLALVMCLSLCACGSKTESNKSNSKNEQQTNESENNNLQQSTTSNEDATINSSVSTDNTAVISEWEQILFNTVWYGKSHGQEFQDELEFVFYEDGTYGANGERNETWEFYGFYQDGNEYMETAAPWQTTPNYAFEKGLYVANDFTLGITEDGEYVLRTWNDYICYSKSQNQE